MGLYDPPPYDLAQELDRANRLKSVELLMKLAEMHAIGNVNGEALANFKDAVTKIMGTHDA